MEYKEIRKKKIPVLGMGTWGIGGRIEADASQKEKWILAIQDAVKEGITHIDTAEVYGNGLTEEIVGEAIKAFDRDKLFLTSKIWVAHLNYDETIKALNGSLRRLGTDYLDLYIIHKPAVGMKLKETMEALEYLKKKNLIKELGVGNFDNKILLEAQSYLKSEKIFAVQSEFNLLNWDKEVLDFCFKAKMLLIAHTPLMQGYLTKPGIEELDKLAKKYGKTQAQVSLNWILSKPNVVTIPKAANKEHMTQNMGALGWKMQDNDYKMLDGVTNRKEKF